jgi:hypothetical protein
MSHQGREGSFGGESRGGGMAGQPIGGNDSNTGSGDYPDGGLHAAPRRRVRPRHDQQYRRLGGRQGPDLWRKLGRVRRRRLHRLEGERLRRSG